MGKSPVAIRFLVRGAVHRRRYSVDRAARGHSIWRMDLIDGIFIMSREPAKPDSPATADLPWKRSSMDPRELQSRRMATCSWSIQKTMQFGELMYSPV